MYTIDGVTNKYKVFQEFYYRKNNVQLSYTQALSYYSQLSKEELEEFAKYYQDETGYEIISANGTSFGEDAQYTDTGIKKKKTVKKKTKDGSFGGYETKEYTVYSTNANKANIMMKYSMEAYAKKTGQILDPVWSQYSAEEIIAMEDTGVNIPKDILELAHAIQENTSANYDNTGEQNDNADETSEKMPFLEAVKVAQKKIEACEENDEKIEDQINDLLPEKDKQERTLKEKIKEQEDAFDRFKKIMKDWTNLQDKINRGEALTSSENKRYIELRKMFENEDFKAKSKNSEYAFDENEIARSLNMINVLAAKGEILGAETEEMGELLADYTSKNNFKTTRKEVRQTLGFFATFIAMVKGKKLATLATEVGEETKEFSTDSINSVNEIASILDIEDKIQPVDNNIEAQTAELETETTEADQTVEPENQPEENPENNMPANLQDADAEVDAQTTEDINPDAATDATSNAASIAPKEDVNNEDAENIQNNEENKPETDVTESQEKFKVTDANVKKLIAEAKTINSDVVKQIKVALSTIKVAKSDIKFAKIADKRVTKLVKEFIEAEEKRQQEIKEKEEENNKSKKEIEKLTGKSSKEIDKEIQNGSTNKKDNADAPVDESIQEEVEQYKKSIIDNNQKIEEIKNESESEKAEFGEDTSKEKNIINKAIPSENKALKINTEYQEKQLPEHNERMDFVYDAGTTLSKIGCCFVLAGARLVYVAQTLLSNPFTMTQGAIMMSMGLASIAKGNISLAIGTEAIDVSDDRSLIELAEETTDIAGVNVNKAITDLTALDQKIISVTEEEGADNSTGEEKQDEAGKTENGENTNSNETSDATAPAASETAETQQTQPATATEQVDEATAVPPSDAETVQEEVQNVAQDEKTENENTTAKTRAAALVDEKTEEKEDEKAPSTDSTGASSGVTNKKEDKEELTTDKAQDTADDSTKEAKEDNKDTLEITKDTEKTEKELEKEQKQLEKLMKKDNKEIIKLTKESEKNALKQEEILTEYETLVNENEQLYAEDENNNKSNPAPAQKTQNNNEEDNQSATSAFGIMAGQQGNTSNNTDTIAANDARINELGIEFKGLGSKIDRNRTKITQYGKATKKRQKKFEKVTKIKDQKAKETAKKEEEKQKKLQKRVAAVGACENLFSITMSTGTIMMAIPWTAAAGTILFNIGLKGTLACGVAKAAIYLADGNITAGLMALGQTALTAATAMTGTGAASGTVLGSVSAGLSVVSSTAELVNNVRAIEGKEANGFMSKLSTIAGVASGITSSAATLQGLGKSGASSFGKAMQISGVVGSSLTSASQIISMVDEDSKAAQILGTIGGVISTAASIGQIADAKFGKSSSKNEENKQKAEESKENEQGEPSKEPKKAKTDKGTENSPEAALNKKSTADDVLADNGSGIVESYSGMSDEQIAAAKADLANRNQNAGRSEVVESYSGMSDEQIAAAKTQLEKRNANSGTSEIVSSASLEDLGLKDSGTKLTGGVLTSTSGNDGRFVESDKALNGLVSSTAGTMPSTEQTPSASPIKEAMKGADMEAVTESAKVKMNETGSKIKEQQQQQIDKQIKKQQRKETMKQVTSAVSGALGAGQSILSMSQSGQANTATKKPAPAGRLTKRAQEIMKKNRKRVQALSGKGYTSLNKKYA